MKVLLSVLASVSMIAAMAIDSIKTDFTKPEASKQWTIDGYSGHKPFPTFAYDAASKSFRCTKAQGAQGVMYKANTLIDAKKSQIIVVNCEIKGTGVFKITTEYFAAKSNWTGMHDKCITFPLTGDWQKRECRIVVQDKKTPTAKVMMDFGCQKGSEFYIRNFSAAVSK